MAAELVTELRASGAEVHVAMLNNAANLDNATLEQVGEHAHARHTLPCRGAWDTQTFTELRRLMQRERIDVVHSHKYKTTFYALGARAWTGCGLVTTYHNWILTSPALRAYARLDKALARFNDFAVGVSRPITDELLRWAPERRVCQIDNGISLDRFPRQEADESLRAQLCGRPQAPLLGFVGRLAPEKALPDLLQALTDPRLQEVQVALAGDGPERASLEAQIAQSRLTERVRLLGHRTDTADIYRAVDALVLPSHMEAFPMVLLEAMACAKPVIATRVGDVERIVSEGQDGYIVPPAKPEALADAIAALIGQEERGSAMGRSGSAKVRERFSSRTMAQRYLTLYERSHSPV